MIKLHNAKQNMLILLHTGMYWKKMLDTKFWEIYTFTICT
jgi:hypothetical protein